MNRKTRPTYVNNGTIRIYGREYRMDTYFPMGKAHPEYKIFHIWEKTAVREGESFTFASEDGFFDWLDAKQVEGEQRTLF